MCLFYVCFFLNLENYFEIIYVVVDINSLFLSFTHLPVDGYLACFKSVAITNKAVVNICILIFVWIHAFTYLG